MPEFYLEYDRTENALREALTEPKIRMEDGYIAVPERPGLGIEVNEDALKQYAQIID